MFRTGLAEENKNILVTRFFIHRFRDNYSEIMRTFPNVCIGDQTMLFEHVQPTTCKNKDSFTTIR
jgi:hypothetical protein